MDNPRSLPPNVLDALRRGNKVEAVRLLREAARIGLAEAKSAVDHHAATATAQHKPSAPGTHAPHVAPSTYRHGGLSPGEVPPSSLGGAAIAILLAVVVLLAWLFSGS